MLFLTLILTSIPELVGIPIIYHQTGVLSIGGVNFLLIAIMYHSIFVYSNHR